MTKPTREEVLKIKTYIATWTFMPDQEILRNLCDAYLAQEEELENYADIWSDTLKQNEALKAENQVLKERVEAMVQAIKDEPELPGPMPDGMLNDIEKAGIEETMRVVVRETKMGILRRINL